MNIIEELQWRGLVKQITNEERLLKAQKEHYAVYCGFDPTAESLHIGHLVPIICLKRFELAGFKATALIGGGTGMIGDPSGRSLERNLLDDTQLNKNVEGIKQQLKSIIPEIELANNADWLRPINIIDFLRDVGKHFTISYLLNKESIATRLSSGLSFTEFTYTMIQAYDFYNLYINNNCKVQLGGSDQWGNITSGTDYISTKVGADKTEAAGVVMQLLLKSDGTKFGKSASGAIWLDESKTSVYNFYQFLINQNDADVENLLKFLTFLTKDEIDGLKKKHLEDPKKHVMQKKLADLVTSFVHGESKTNEAKLLTDAFFKGSILQLKPDLVELAIKSMNSIEVKKDDLFIDAAINVKAVNSKREYREFISSKALSANNKIIDSESIKVTDFEPILGNKIIIKRGKKNYYVLEIL